MRYIHLPLILLLSLISHTTFASEKKASCEKTQELAIANMALGIDKVWNILKVVNNKATAQKALPQLEHCMAYLKVIKQEAEKENWEPKTKDDQNTFMGILFRMSEAAKGIENKKTKLKKSNIEAYKIVSAALE